MPEAASQARVHLMRLKVRACMRRCHHPLPRARTDATSALQAMAEHPDHARVESREFTQQIVEQYQALILGLATFDAASASTGAVAVLATRARSTRTRPGGPASGKGSDGGGGGCCGGGGASGGGGRDPVPSAIHSAKAQRSSRVRVAEVDDTTYDSDAEVDRLLEPLSAHERRSIVHCTARELLPLLIKVRPWVVCLAPAFRSCLSHAGRAVSPQMLVQETNPGMMVPDQVLTAGQAVDMQSHSVRRSLQDCIIILLRPSRFVHAERRLTQPSVAANTVYPTPSRSPASAWSTNSACATASVHYRWRCDSGGVVGSCVRIGGPNHTTPSCCGGAGAQVDRVRPEPAWSLSTAGAPASACHCELPQERVHHPQQGESSSCRRESLGVRSVWVVRAALSATASGSPKCTCVAQN